MGMLAAQGMPASGVYWHTCVLRWQAWLLGGAHLNDVVEGAEEGLLGDRPIQDPFVGVPHTLEAAPHRREHLPRERTGVCHGQPCTLAPYTVRRYTIAYTTVYTIGYV